MPARPDVRRDTLADCGYSGFVAIERLVASTGYGNIEQIIASLTVFSHPNTVAQTSNQAIFRTIRARGDNKRHNVGMASGRLVMYDDNTVPQDAFLWANGFRYKTEFPECQFNHIYGGVHCQNPEIYTSLANICITPAFLAKLTDTHRSIPALLKFRSFTLYGWAPNGEIPKKPDNYDSLEWADTLPPTTDVKAAIEKEVVRRPKSRAALSIKECGWLFGA
ncbi:hypothetical protein [Acidocella sp.]|uniref:hypothetical protein n=1 Tax=Acidocella sp. TaxID=50710 RepID=UPI00262EBD0C|nr:hypothetical protein [Acidocella sp.]